MLAKRTRYDKSLEIYFYEKINLLHRLEIKGKRAVDCLVHGVEDRSVRLSAKAAKCEEPEQVLKFFQSVKQRLREFDKNRNASHKINEPVISNENTSSTNSSVGIKKPSMASQVICYNCNEQGHYSFKCTKKIIKCTVCNKLGHLTINCSKLPSDVKNADVKEKAVMLVKMGNMSNNKYKLNVEINGQPMVGYVDLGSECTLLRGYSSVEF
ncbi:uncharacterized protein [Cardiocondyla obscurior]|uniref:uncharacterized protein n=1 Tax=Cardiocondyla obscurior TaxID=286306 RepID=UPI00396564E6